MKRVYLSGPIDHVSMDQAKSWREDAKDLLVDFEVIDALRGHGNWIEHPPEINEVVIRDKNDLDTCDIVLVNMSKAVPMIGTPMEILYAWEKSKPVIIWSNWADKNYWARYHSVKILPTLEECVDYIKSFWG